MKTKYLLLGGSEGQNVKRSPWRQLCRQEGQYEGPHIPKHYLVLEQLKKKKERKTRREVTCMTPTVLNTAATKSMSVTLRTFQNV